MRKLRSFQVVCSILLTMTLCAGAVSCSTDSYASGDPGFTIEGASAETEYQVPEDRTIQLAGSGFQTGDAIRLTDTGLSGHYYTIRPVIEASGISMLLPKSFVSGQYRIDVIRGNKQFTYGRTSLWLSGDFDYSRIQGHPRVMMTATDFEALKQNIRNSPELQSLHALIISKTEKFMDTPATTYELIGHRLLAACEQAFYRIVYASYAYRMTGDSRYLNKAEQELRAVCGFSDWNDSRHYLDVGTMAGGVAIGYDWLYNELQEDTKVSIRHALTELAFKTSDQQLQYSDSYLKLIGNWNQVCNGGLLMAALAMYEDDTYRCRIAIERAVNSNQTAMAMYAPSGVYSEGYAYWGYGTIYEAMIINSLEKIFGKDRGLSASEGFRETPEYILYVTALNHRVFNYGDSNQWEYPNPAMWWFAQKYNDPSLLVNEIRLLREGYYHHKDSDDSRLPMVMCFAHSLDLTAAKNPEKKLWSSGGETPLVLVHTDWTRSETDKFLGIKGGKGRGSHKHLDAGTFVYDAFGQTWAMDLGLQSYGDVENAGISTDEDRWTKVFRLRSDNHNTLTINGVHHNPDGFCNIVEVYDTDTELGARLDMSAVLNPGTQSAFRTVKLVNETNLKITDEIQGAADKSTQVRWSMVTPATPVKLSDSCFQLSQNGKTLYMTVEATCGCTLKTWTTHSDNAWDSDNGNTVIVGFEATLTPGQAATFTTTLSPEK